MGAALKGSLVLQVGEIPPAVLDIIAESERDFPAALWRWTPCSCLDAPSEVFPWNDAKSKAVQLVKEQQWQRAIFTFQHVSEEM